MPYLITAYALNIIDYIFTAYWVHKFGIEIEANPIGRWMFENNITWVVKIFIVGGAFAVLGYFIKREQKAVILVKILLIVYGGIVVYHLIILFKVILIYAR